jgi:hypothetical protein
LAILTDAMRILSAVLTVKIIFTILLWVVPLLLFPTVWLHHLGFPVPEPQIFLRLLGMAYLALAVGYAFGLRSALRGIYPVGVVWTGIVSNGGAFLLLAIAAIHKVWASWEGVAGKAMWISLVATGAITVGLIVVGPLREISRPSGQATRR